MFLKDYKKVELNIKKRDNKNIKNKQNNFLNQNWYQNKLKEKTNLI